MSFFVKYPPEGDSHYRLPRVVPRQWDDGEHEPAEWKPCTLGIEPEYYEAVRQIRNLESTFNDTGKPGYALEAFRIATSVKLYPPLWVIEFLDQRFKHAFYNKHSLDRAFGFSKGGLGRGKATDPIKAAKLTARNRLLCLAIFKLEGAGLSRPAACKALSSLLARMPDGQKLAIGGDGLHAISRMDITGKGIEKAVNESEESWSENREATATAALNWTDSEKAKLLSIFYPSELPKPR